MHKRRNIICNVHADLDCSMGLGPAVRNLRYHVFQGVVLWWEWKGGRNRKASQTRPLVMDRRSGMERSEDPLYSIPPSQGAERSGSGSGRLDALPITVSQICSPPSFPPPPSPLCADAFHMLELIYNASRVQQGVYDCPIAPAATASEACYPSLFHMRVPRPGTNVLAVKNLG
jgi:hypothetical protein